mgnify:CR=1 FL=1|tara:strand:+ start:111 stop:719 length:609 start_codon:yes stop_codon:yes gene_type:complete
MQTLRKHPWLTGLLLLLIGMKFILVPIIEWQNEQLLNIKLQTKRISRAELALANVDNNVKILNHLHSQNQKLDKLFYPFSEEASFKLQQQQWLESLIAKHQFKINNVGWVFSAKVLGQPLIKHQLSVSVEGPTYAMPSLQAELEANSQWVDINSFTFNVRGQSDVSLGNVSGNVDLVFYQWDKSSQKMVENGNVNQGQVDEQ